MDKLDKILHAMMVTSFLTIAGIGGYYHWRRETLEKELNVKEKSKGTN